MTNIELYINEKLCDILNPENLGVRLNRVLMNPAELTSKDAQYSYSITIPSSPANDAIFNYTNVEEVKNKFNHHRTAQLYVDSVKVFDGLFKLSEISEEGNYKGNLVLPAIKTVKELFGDKKMSDIGFWKLDLKKPDDPSQPMGIAETISLYNKMEGTPDCIFPMVLYGLLPKVAMDDEGKYSGKKEWDKYVRLGVEDFPPSINCLKAIKKIFANAVDDKGRPLEITGTAFDDSRLTNLYMSYQNAVDYEQPWNWGHLGKMRIAGNWTNFRNENGRDYYEWVVDKNETERNVYVANLFNSSMTRITTLESNGTNILHSELLKDDPIKRRSQTHITIPVSGLYEINLSASIRIDSTKNDRWRKGPVDILSGSSSVKDNKFSSRGYEFKLLRDFGEGEFQLDNIGIDGHFYRNNMPQDPFWYQGVLREYFFPVSGEHCVQFVDPAQNQLLLSGFRWGERKSEAEINPLDRDNLKSRILAIKHGWSWDNQLSQKDKIYSAINSDGYMRWGLVEGEDDEDSEDQVDENDEVIEVPDVWEWQTSKKMGVTIDGIPKNKVERLNEHEANGELHQIVWLNKGEHLTLVSVSDEGEYKRSGGWSSTKRGWVRHDIEFDLSLRPYRKDKEWITIDNTGTGTNAMKWKDDTDFLVDHIDLSKFLPLGTNVDDWLDHFCKAFNLDLQQPEPGKFSLDVKVNNAVASAASVVDLDSKTSILKRTNQALGLPSEFKLGFTINKEEEGYYRSLEQDPNNKYEDGGGSFQTGSIDGKVLSQTSKFSYNWFKDITCNVLSDYDSQGQYLPEKTTLWFPVISHFELWLRQDGQDYAEMMPKLYTNYGQRFWYKTGKQYNLGTPWYTKPEVAEGEEAPVADEADYLWLCELSNSYRGDYGALHLNYHDEANSIMHTYFGTVVTDDSNYTLVECYLAPYEYEQLGNMKLVQLNGDLYYVAAIEGYDPAGRNPTKLKLIRKI